MNEFKIPDIAQGKVVPDIVWMKEMEEAKEKELRKKQFRHDWRIAIFSLLGGGIMGFVTSFVFWIITNSAK